MYLIDSWLAPAERLTPWLVDQYRLHRRNLPQPKVDTGRVLRVI